MGLDMSIVFKLTSLDDLKNLANALDETVTFQAKIQLEEEIKRLIKQKNKLKVELEALRMEKNGMAPPSKKDKEEAEDEVMAEPPTTLGDEARTLIEDITEEPVEEVEEIVEVREPEEHPQE